MHAKIIACLIAASFLQGLAQAEPPPTVEVSRPIVRDVVDYEQFSGRAEAIQAADIRARVSGHVVKVAYRSGETVKEGDLLFEIDPRSYRAALDLAEAELTRGEAHLARLKADAARLQRLAATGAVSKEEVDKALHERAEAEASLRAARAAREAAQLNLQCTKVVAPFTGRTGRPLVTPGSLVRADETLLTLVDTVDPIQVAFDVDEKTALRWRRLALAGKGKVAAPVMMGLLDEEGYPRRGAVESVDTRVKPETSTLQMRAVFANRDQLILPGMSARIRLPLGEPYKALLVPDQAVVRKERKGYVFVVDAQNIIERRPVQLGHPQPDGLRVVKEGLTPEDSVVVHGLKDLQPGMKVEPRPGKVPEGPRVKPGEEKP